MNEVLFNEYMNNISNEITNNKTLVMSYINSQIELLQAKLEAVAMYAGLTPEQVNLAFSEGSTFNSIPIISEDKKKATGEINE